MAVVKNLTDLSDIFKNYKGRITLYPGKSGDIVAARIGKEKIPRTAEFKVRTGLLRLIRRAFKELQGNAPDKAAEWDKRAAFYKRWYKSKMDRAYGGKYKFHHAMGIKWIGENLFLRCNILAYYAGLTILRWLAPTLSEKINPPSKPLLRFDGKSIVVHCPPPDLPKEIKEATIEVFARNYSVIICPVFKVGSINGFGSKLEISFPQFRARTPIFGKRWVRFKDVHQNKIEVWTRLVVTQGENYGALDSPPSASATLELPANPHGKRYSDKVKIKWRNYRKKLYYQRKEIG
ncbi:hypothetical protein HY605_00205 [Candidatus Peregrinibacteria bacterium]|nr:hypothetical protein [Candidatus Peregrinibacteria bacterium]